MTRSRGAVAFLGALALALLPAAASAAGTQGSIENVFPGVWGMAPETSTAAVDDCCNGPALNIPFTPKYRKIRDDYAPTDATMTIGNLRHCITPGVPGTFLHPILFEFLFTPGRVNLIFEDGSYRRIWVDGRSFPDDIEPSMQGYSIGRWEGKKLIVETRGLSTKSELLMGGPIHATSKTRVTEEMSIEKDGRLHVRITTDEPEVYTRPYVFDAYYIGVPVLFETGCAANNRHGEDESIDLSLPPD